MVDPISDEERAAFVRRLKLAFVLLVAASSALITVQSGASIASILAAAGAGAVVALLCLWIVVP